MTTVAILLFGISGLFGTYRLLKGPGLADRVMALDVTLLSLMGAIAVDAAARGDTTNLVMLVVIAIIGFTATVAASGFLVGEGRPGVGPDGTVGTASDTGSES